MKKWQIESRNVNELKVHDKNPRTLSKEEASQLRKSISKFGLIDLPIITKDNRVIGGHQRLNILSEMNIKTVNCWVPEFDDLTEEDIDELNIRLNKNQGQWDWDILANEWDINNLVDWGFKDDDFDETKPEKKKKPAVTYEFCEVDDLKMFMSQVEGLGIGTIEKTKGKSMKPNKKPKPKKSGQMSNEQQAAQKAKISKQPLIPNREPFDQGTCI